MIRLVNLLVWRIAPLVVLVWLLRSSAVQYGKVFRKVAHASRYTMTYVNMLQYVPALEAHVAAQGELPRDVTDFLQGSFTSRGNQPGMDAWGTPFELDEDASSFTLRSCGPDRRCGTDDDVAQQGKKLPGRRGRRTFDD